MDSFDSKPKAHGRQGFIVAEDLGDGYLTRVLEAWRGTPLESSGSCALGISRKPREQVPGVSF